jgi:NADPH:quinone reductase-like Zn-dependent oxidoreductase
MLAMRNPIWRPRDMGSMAPRSMSAMAGDGNAPGRLDRVWSRRVQGFMRAWQVRKHGEPRDALQIVDAPVPQVPPGLLRVRVAACGVGLPDLFMCRGSYALTPALPFTPGQELVGAVTEAGEGAEMAVGQRVMAVSAFFLGHGGFADEALALDEFAFAVPDDVADSAAAGFVIPYHTAYVGLVRRVRPVARDPRRCSWAGRSARV